jgi:hypothetical protein
MAAVTRALRIVGGGIEPAQLARAQVATRLATLEDVLRFGFTQQPSWEVVDVIVQDEFTHDVVVHGPAYLVFDTT